MPAGPFPREPSGPTLRLVAGSGGGSARASPADDDRLIDAFAARRPDAGSELYVRLFPVVDATLYRISGQRGPDHPDLVQSVFEQIVSTLSKRKFARNCSLAGWAAVLACHVGLNAIRSRRRERAVVDREHAAGEAGEATVSDHASGLHPELKLRARDDLDAVRRHLAEMDPDRVKALLLNAMGHELAEIAGLTGTSIAAAQSRLSRGRRELKSRMEQASSAMTPPRGRRT